MRRASAILVAIVLSAGLLEPAATAQSARSRLAEHDYTTAIRQLMSPDSDRKRALSDEEMSILGLAYLRRGLLFYDLAQLQVTLGMRYYSLRDTADSATRSPQTPFFLGRYQYEAGDYRSALQAFERALREDGTSATLRARARLWAGAALAGLGRPSEAEAMWTGTPVSSRPEMEAELAYARWRAGSVDGAAVWIDPKVGESVVGRRLALWHAAISGRVGDLYAATETLIDANHPDETDAIAGGVEIAFYDPATWRIVSRSDLRSALAAFERLATQTSDAGLRRQARLLAGRAAVELYYAERALQNLSGIDHPDATLLRGAAAAIQGDLAGADRMWKAVSSPENLDWIDLVTRIPGRATEAFSAYRVFRGRRLDANSAVLLARSLLRAGAVRETQDVLRGTALVGASATALPPPALLANLSRAELATGRRHQTEVLGYLYDLQRIFPAVRTSYEIAQSVLALDQGEGGLMLRN